MALILHQGQGVWECQTQHTDVSSNCGLQSLTICRLLLLLSAQALPKEGRKGYLLLAANKAE